MINIAELLKDAPKGMKLYSPLFGEVEYMQLGDENKVWVKTSCGTYYFDKYGKPYAFDKAECLLFPSKDCRTWEGWELTVKPKFKVGDWVVIDNCHNSIYQVEGVSNYDYMLKHTHGGLMPFPFSSAERLRLWSIADAKDGDVLVSSENSIFIYNGNRGEDTLGAYGGVLCIGFDRASTVDRWTSIYRVKPATKEQRDLLFAKMKEAGYQWDAGKKELKKIPKHYDISNFHAGMPVLVRDANDEEWRYVLYSHNTGRYGLMRFNAEATIWNQCIPFEGNEHLLGTTDMCDECYVNW